MGTCPYDINVLSCRIFFGKLLKNNHYKSLSVIQTHLGNVSRMQSFVKENLVGGGGGLCKGVNFFFFFLENVKRFLHSSGGLNQTLEHVSAISALIDNKNNLVH